jgi:hypothetical protein
MTALAGLASGVAVAQDACGPLAQLELEGTTIVSATNVASGGSMRAPAYCEVHAAISPVAGSKIGAVYRLPSQWNGKVLGIGGGGFAGNVRAEAAADGLTRGYAVIQNDLGHPSASALDAGTAPRTSRPKSASKWSNGSTVGPRNAPTGKAARRAAAKVLRKCSGIPATTTA